MAPSLQGFAFRQIGAMETKERIEPTVVEQPDPPAPPGSMLQLARARITQHIRFHPREAGALAVLGLLLLIGAGLAYMRARPAAAITPPSGAISASASASAAAANTIVVDVVGAVRKPGVYDFAQGARVIDAVRAAGGFLPDAEPQAINLARPLVDGEQVVVLKKGEAAAGAAGSGSSAQQPGGKVNINSATESDFENLPGIGPVLAQKIVDYRDQHGPFRSIQDLMKVSGIGQK
jgi:competence protein ComEA